MPARSASDVQLVGDLLVDEFAAFAVGRLVHDVDRPAVQRRQLRKVSVGHEAGDGPGAGTGHLHLALHQRLHHLQVGEQGTALEQLGSDLAVRRRLDLAEEIAHRHVARMRRRGVQRATQLDRRGGIGAADEGGGQWGGKDSGRRGPEGPAGDRV
jgi:hypothetical protein